MLPFFLTDTQQDCLYVLNCNEHVSARSKWFKCSFFGIYWGDWIVERCSQPDVRTLWSLDVKRSIYVYWPEELHDVCYPKTYKWLWQQINHPTIKNRAVSFTYDCLKLAGLVNSLDKWRVIHCSVAQNWNMSAANHDDLPELNALSHESLDGKSILENHKHLGDKPQSSTRHIRILIYAKLRGASISHSV